MAEIPCYGFAQSTCKIFLRLPAKFSANFRRIDGVAQIMAGPVSNKTNQVLIIAYSFWLLRLHFIKKIAQCPYDIYIAFFSVATYSVGFSNAALFEYKKKCSDMITNIEPVA